MSVFDSIPRKSIDKNKFDLSYMKLLSLTFGQILPVYHQEALPGGHYRVNTEMLIRMAPMLAPVMHMINAYVHYFFVPNRIVWNDWETFITGGEDGISTASMPYLTLSDGNTDYFKRGRLPDYFNIPWIDGTVTGSKKVNILALKAYHLIYNEWYRDQALDPPVEIRPDLGGDNFSIASQLTTIRFRSFEKDYYTSARPEAQLGAPQGVPINFINPATGTIEFQTVSGNTPASGNTKLDANGAFQSSTSQNLDFLYDPNILIEDLRRSARLQEWLETNARAGNRYTENLRAHFGVSPQDSRLQRPEYIGGGKMPLSISEVVATANSETTTWGEGAVGDMYGHGIAAGKAASAKYHAQEHGYIIGLLSIIPRTGYFGGLPREYDRFDKFDYFWPEFQNLGEQEVYKSELWINPAQPGSNDGEVFGYQQRYAEYKYRSSECVGDFRDQLKYWHLNRTFTANPALNANFVRCLPGTHDLNRIFNITAQVNNFWVQAYNKVDAILPIVYNSDPTL